jgi:hypothetical protein
MPRKPSAILQYKLRIRENLRRRIEKAAEKNRVSANYEMVSRLERSFDQEHTIEIAAVAGHIEAAWARLDQIFHDLNKQGDLLRAAEELVAQIEQLLPAERQTNGIKKAVERVKQIGKVIDIEATLVARRMHTTGAN